ncbi:MAG TPA: hypothetical protein VHN59_02665 [Chitinophagaceae bacterium]|nr:hypothetical protein [Chitinophagaceae bacterium]
MKRAFRYLLLSVILLISVQDFFAQDAYRTNFSTNAARWTNTEIWQRFDSIKKAWVAADHYPAYQDGTITIQAGDSVVMDGSDTARMLIDEVIIEAGGSLTLVNKGDIILNDGKGDDIVVNGRMHIGTDGALRGNGRIQVNAEGAFTIKNGGLLAAAVNNKGTMYWGSAGETGILFSGCHIVNDATCTWMNGDIIMDSSATFINNGLMRIMATTSNLICAGNKRLPAKITNKGTIINTGKDHTVDFQVKVDNNGTIGGVGTFLFSGGSNSGGVISPGASPGHLTVGPGKLRSSTINIEIATTGAIAGVNYDQLTVNSLEDLAGAIINITDQAADSINTEYTIINAMPGNTVKSYPEVVVNAPSNLAISFKGNRLVLTKIAADPLPVSWGGFKVVAHENKAVLNWNTLLDQHTSYFLIEHSTNAITYAPVARIDARHGESGEAQYNYTFSGIDVFKTNYFRIRKVNKDGKSRSSAPRNIVFNKGRVVGFQSDYNPGNDELNLNIQTEHLRAYLTDTAGRLLYEFSLQPGQYTVYMDALPADVYRMNVSVKGVMVEAKQIVKH